MFITIVATVEDCLLGQYGHTNLERQIRQIRTVPDCPMGSTYLITARSFLLTVSSSVAHHKVARQMK